MKIKVKSRDSKRGSGLKIRRIGVSTIILTLAGCASAGFGIQMFTGLEHDTSAKSNTAINLSDSIKINPVYEEYLADVAAGEGDKWELIPNKYIPVDNSRNYIQYGAGSSTSNLPSQYSLIDEGYGTAIKNQSVDNICWAYTITSAVESYLLKNGIADTELSPKQMDYFFATSIPYGNYMESLGAPAHNISDAFSFMAASIGFPSGLTPVSESDFFTVLKNNDESLKQYDNWKQYNDEKMLNAILGFGATPYTNALSYDEVVSVDSEYVINEFEDLQFNTNTDINLIKESVYQNGAAFVGTVAPNVEGCYDADTKTIVDRGADICDVTMGHAMAVVGWDDNHKYTDPADGITKTGAFILQNSYGTSSLFRDFDITYDSLVEDGIIDPTGHTEAEIQYLKDFIANYDANEILYLSYQAPTSNSTSDFGLIQEIMPNHYDKIYSPVMGEGYVSTEFGSDKSEVVNTYTTNGREEYIYSIATASYLVVFAENTTFTVSVDSGNGFKKVGSLIIPKNSQSTQKVLKLSEPIPVKNTYKVKISVTEGDKKVLIGDEYLRLFATSTYNKIDNTTPTDNPERPNTGSVTWIQGEEYTIGGDKDLIVRINYELSFFKSITLDGEPIPEEYYSLKSGSTIITVSHEYLNELEEGEHVIEVAFDFNDSKVRLGFNASERIEVPNTADGGTPNTGAFTKAEGSNALVMGIVLPGAIFIVVLGTVLVNRNKNHVSFNKR